MTKLVHWIDTHCHLNAAEFWPIAKTESTLFAIKNGVFCVIPAVQASHFEAVRELAHAGGDAYCLGIHPLYVERAQDDDLALLEATLTRLADDPRLVAVGEIGLDFFVPALQTATLRARQQHFYQAQLKLARQHKLPVVLHSRHAVDAVLAGLRAVARSDSLTADDANRCPSWHGIAHAFNGSEQQARHCINLGLKLGFGGALTFERALQLRRLASRLPLASLVLETDAPDMPPHWLYKTARQRSAGEPQGINSPAELPRIAAELAQLRGISVTALAAATYSNALAALPKLGQLLHAA